MTASRAATPPSHSPSPASSASTSRHISRHNSASLSLDLSNLPPLITPSPPTNTLLITNLLDPSIFHPASLATIRESISRTQPLYSFSPLKSFRRIIVSFYSTDAAIEVRQLLDGSCILNNRVKIFFGANTPISDADQKDRHLAAPDAGKLFFISPPPSPPHGWMMRNEDPPNKEVHAEDLATALDKLKAKTWVAEGENGMEVDQNQITPVSPTRPEGAEKLMGGVEADSRQRSGSTTIVYHPDHHGDSPALPAVMVEDTTGEDDFGAAEKKIMAHTSRPPTELMEH